VMGFPVVVVVMKSDSDNFEGLFGRNMVVWIGKEIDLEIVWVVQDGIESTEALVDAVTVGTALLRRRKSVDQSSYQNNRYQYLLWQLRISLPDCVSFFNQNKPVWQPKLWTKQKTHSNNSLPCKKMEMLNYQLTSDDSSGKCSQKKLLSKRSWE
jgi:hypothetical protein